MLPIRSSGERPAFHVVGATGSFGPDDVPTAEVEAATHLHLVGPEFMGGEAAAPLLRAREHRAVTFADVPAPGEPGLLDWIAPALAELDYLQPNGEQVLALTGADELENGCRALLERGVGCVAAICGADGVVLVDADSVERVPRSRSRRWTPAAAETPSRPASSAVSRWGASARDAAPLGCATAALVAQGLGTDDGDFDLDVVEQLVARR